MVIQGGQGTYYPGRNLTLRCRTAIIVKQANYIWYFTASGQSERVVVARQPMYKQTYFTLQDAGLYTCAAHGAQASVNVEAEATFNWERIGIIGGTFGRQTQGEIRFANEYVIPVAAAILIMLCLAALVFAALAVVRFERGTPVQDKGKHFGWE